MNREDAKDAKEEEKEDAVLPSRSLRLRGLIIIVTGFDMMPLNLGMKRDFPPVSIISC